MTTSGTRSSRPKVELIRGEMADALLKDAQFQQAWAELEATCMWSTSCQSWGFADAWLSVYRNTHEALLVVQRDGAGLVGLLPLAIDRVSGQLVHVGAHQAEYQVWLAIESNATSFIELALDALAGSHPGRRLELQYLPPGSPVDWCKSGSPWGDRTILQEKKRPLLALGPNSPVEESLRKKSNKSRINRLKKIAPLTLVQLQTREQLAEVIDTIADYCDLRQGAINASLPFRDDPRKKEFCLQSLERPGITHASALMLGDMVVAANIGLKNRTSVSLGIVVHSPFLAEHSPGKLLILLLARELGRQGFTDFDLTPGGDMYKDRSADHYDTVHTLRVFFDQVDHLREAAKARVRTATIRVVESHSPVLASRLKTAARAGLRAILTSAIGGTLQQIYDRRNTHYYTVSAEEAQKIHPPSLFKTNCISDLLCYQPACKKDRSTTQFLFEASRNLEAGDRAYTLVENGVLLHCSWINQSPDGRSPDDGYVFDYPPGSCLVWDDYVHPEARGRGLTRLSLEQRLHDAAMLPGIDTILVSIDANDTDGVAAFGLDQMKYFGTVTEETRFGIKQLRFGQ
jgi:CelD/BcsL family acetyltransferase involved in cellulose biosynthesis